MKYNFSVLFVSQLASHSVSKMSNCLQHSSFKPISQLVMRSPRFITTMPQLKPASQLQ